jgi:hypothetical protein
MTMLLLIVVMVLLMMTMTTSNFVKVKGRKMIPIRARNLQLHAAARQLPKGGIGATTVAQKIEGK